MTTWLKTILAEWFSDGRHLAGSRCLSKITMQSYGKNFKKQKFFEKKFSFTLIFSHFARIFLIHEMRYVSFWQLHAINRGNTRERMRGWERYGWYHPTPSSHSTPSNLQPSQLYQGLMLTSSQPKTGNHKIYKIYKIYIFFIFYIFYIFYILPSKSPLRLSSIIWLYFYFILYKIKIKKKKRKEIYILYILRKEQKKIFFCLK